MDKWQLIITILVWLLGHTLAMPVDTYIPAWVTNNQLTISVRGYRPDSMPGYPMIMPVLEGIEILPDNARRI